MYVSQDVFEFVDIIVVAHPFSNSKFQPRREITSLEGCSVSRTGAKSSIELCDGVGCSGLVEGNAGVWSRAGWIARYASVDCAIGVGALLAEAVDVVGISGGGAGARAGAGMN
jgi:hypothetical protein